MRKFNNELNILGPFLYKTVTDLMYNKIVSFSYNNYAKALYLKK